MEDLLPRGLVLHKPGIFQQLVAAAEEKTGGRKGGWKREGGREGGGEREEGKGRGGEGGREE